MFSIKRRDFCRHMILGSAFFAGSIVTNSSFAIDSNYSQNKSRYKWVVLYWMPYDNDLVRFGEPIVEMLTQGTQNSENLVVVQSDYWGDSNMRRRLFSNGIVNEIDIAGEDSSDVSAFRDYLNWANLNFEAQHWAVIIVGHGGKINEVSPDDHKAIDKKRTWMGVDQFADAVSSFNRSTKVGVELLFFQNCNKATLEVLYEVRNCARYTLASQLALGAPNYYYKGFLNRLKDPSVKGREAAIAIMDSERIDMYHTLTLVDNQTVKLIPEKLSQVLKRIINKGLPAIKQSELSTYHYSGERHCDALLLLGYLSRTNNRVQNELSDFAEFLLSSVTVYYKTGGELYGSFYKNTNLEKLCGMSLYLPENKQEIYRYRSLDLYQEVGLVDLYRKIFSV